MPCQGIGRGFESRLPLQHFLLELFGNHKQLLVVKITGDRVPIFQRKPPKSPLAIFSSRPKPYICCLSSENFPEVQIFNSKHLKREVFMDNYRLIIRHLRLLAGLSVQQTSKKIQRKRSTVRLQNSLELEKNLHNKKRPT